MNTEQIDKQDKIIFPDEHKPSNCPVFAHNEINIQASPESIWFWLANATTWHEWYDNASNMEILNQEHKHLQANTKFKWRTFNTNIASEVQEFKENRRLAWIAKGTGLQAYHAWLIIPNKEGCKVITEESQKGWLPWLFRWFIRKGLLKQHQIWLEGLKMKAEAHED